MHMKSTQPTFICIIIFKRKEKEKLIFNVSMFQCGLFRAHKTELQPIIWNERPQPAMDGEVRVWGVNPINDHYYHQVIKVKR